MEQVAVVRQEKQPGRVLVQAPDRLHAGPPRAPSLREEVVHGRPLAGVVPADATARFVHQREQTVGRLRGLAVDEDVARRDLRLRPSDGLTVEEDASVARPSLRFRARAVPEPAEEAV